MSTLLPLCNTKQFHTHKNGVEHAVSAALLCQCAGSTGGMLGSCSREPIPWGLLPKKHFAYKLHLLGPDESRISLKLQKCV